eukprot:m.758329 g.758329  ORF g.758329 m.758329 type:complete len:67 (+) comp59035_c1_seq1:68-268(+)
MCGNCTKRIPTSPNMVQADKAQVTGKIQFIVKKKGLKQPIKPHSVFSKKVSGAGAPLASVEKELKP